MTLEPALPRDWYVDPASWSSERERVLSALLRTNWNVSQAAQELRWSRMTLYRKLRKYQLVKASTPIHLTVVGTPSHALQGAVAFTAPPGRRRPLEDTTPEMRRRINQEA